MRYLNPRHLPSILVLLFLSLLATGGGAQTASIVAVVNGDAITNQDIDARGRLFALSTGLPISPDVLARLRPQILRQLIDEKLRLQEIERRKIVVSDKEIADAIGVIERRNNMPSGALTQRLQSEGVTLRTLVDEVRVQIGWLRVLRDALGDRANISDADIDQRLRSIKERTGQSEYHVGEIFIAVDQPAHAADASRFADTVISELRAGAPFAVVAAQFSQSQTALEGGDLGWVEPNQLDPQVAQIVEQMPQGAISDPIRVAGGYSIVTLFGKRVVGNQMATVLTVREAFLPFSSPLNPAAPTEQQKQTLLKAQQISRTVHSCDEMEAANKEAGNVKPSDPGPVQLDTVSPPQFRAILASLQPGKATPPLPSTDGIAVVIVCSRDEKNVAEQGRQQISNQILDERAELESRALLRDLQRRAMIEQRGV